MANTKVFLLGGSPIIIAFDFDEQGISNSGLNILKFQSYSKEWADFIILNRDKRNVGKVHNYDFVFGPIADDRVGLQVQLFNQNLIELETLLDRIKFHRVTYQFYFGTTEALKYLKKI